MELHLVEPPGGQLTLASPATTHSMRKFTVISYSKLFFYSVANFSYEATQPVARPVVSKAVPCCPGLFVERLFSTRNNNANFLLKNMATIEGCSSRVCIQIP